MTDNGNPAYPPERKALHAALAAAQGEFPKITKDKVADAGSYQYQYASLEHILEVVRPVLSKHGLSIIQPLEELPGGGGPVIRTELRHADGDIIARPFPLGDRPKNPQQLGSLASYIKRYALMGMLGIAPEDDDDGKAAQVAAAKKPASRKPEPPPEPEDLVITDPGAVQLTFGKYEGETIAEVAAKDRRYIGWIAGKREAEDKFKIAAAAFLHDDDIPF